MGREPGSHGNRVSRGSPGDDIKRHRHRRLPSEGRCHLPWTSLKLLVRWVRGRKGLPVSSWEEDTLREGEDWRRESRAGQGGGLGRWKAPPPTLPPLSLLEALGGKWVWWGLFPGWGIEWRLGQVGKSPEV